MISFRSRMQKNLTVEECVSTHTHNHLYFFPLQNAKHYHTYMHAGKLSGCQHITAELSIHLSIHPSLPPRPIHLISCFPPSLPSHLPGLQQGHTPQLPCTHTQTHMHKEQERECDREEDKKGGGESRFHATLSTG